MILFRDLDGNCSQLLSHLPENPNSNFFHRQEFLRVHVVQTSGRVRKTQSSCGTLFTKLITLSVCMLLCNVTVSLSIKRWHLSPYPSHPKPRLVWGLVEPACSRRDTVWLLGFDFRSSCIFPSHLLETLLPLCKETQSCLLVDARPSDEQRKTPTDSQHHCQTWSHLRPSSSHQTVKWLQLHDWPQLIWTQIADP